MKKIMIGLFTVLLATATVFATTQKPAMANDPVLEWFEADGTYIRPELLSEMQQECPFALSICARGYTGKTTDQNGNTIPAGTLHSTVRYNF